MTELKDNEVAVSKTIVNSLAQLYREYFNSYNKIIKDPDRYMQDINVLIGDLLIYTSLSNVENYKYAISGSMSEEEVKKQMLIIEAENKKTNEEEIVNYVSWFVMKRKNIHFYDRAVRDAAKYLDVNITTSRRTRYSFLKDKMEYDMVSTRANYKKFDSWWKEQFKYIDRL